MAAGELDGRAPEAGGGKRLPGGDRLIYSAEPDSLALNLRLDRIKMAVSALFTRASADNLVATPAQVRAAVASAGQHLTAEHDAAISGEFIPTPDSTMRQLINHWRELDTGLLAKKTITKCDGIADWLDGFTNDPLVNLRRSDQGK